jgi:hypothetical protein
MEMDVDEKIKLALQECGGIWCYNIDNKFKYLYPFTTENIAGYINQFDLKDKTFLTVGSSGDQVLNAILHNCKDISVIDLCPFAKEYFYLKKAAVEVFNRKDYLKFFCYSKYDKRYNNNNALCKYEYNKIREVLDTYDQEVAYFWNTLYNRYKGLKIRKRLFSFDETEVKFLSSLNEYLVSDIAYQNLRNKISNSCVNFEVDNLFYFNSDKTYDYINLSNVIDYCSFELFGKLINQLIDHLNVEGTLLIAYLYLVDGNSISNQLRMEKLKIILPDDVQYFNFRSVSGIRLGKFDSHDSVVTYKKVKKI